MEKPPELSNDDPIDPDTSKTKKEKQQQHKYSI